MADLVLSFAMTPYDRVLPLINGEVKPDGITLEYQGMPGAVPGVFYDQIKFGRYDLSEFSMSSFLRQRQHGLPYRMLPIFHNRQFSYTNIHFRVDSGIRQGHPEDLKGKRIGIGDYQQSVGLWTRGSLLQEFGLADSDMIWYQERGEHYSHSGASGLKLTHGVELHYATEDFATMYLKGDLDASIGLGGPAHSALDRDKVDLSNDPRIATLFADPKEEAVRYFKKHGVYQPHHVTVIRESIIKEHPWAARSLMEAFQKSKEIAAERLRRTPPTLMVFGGQWLREINSIFGDPFPYGVGANAKALDFAQTFSVQQNLSERKQPWEEIFPEEILIMEERVAPDAKSPVAV